MNGWRDWRDWVTMGVFVLVVGYGLIGSCNDMLRTEADERVQNAAREAAEAARKDATPLIETCVTHPSARRVVVQ